MKSIFPLPTPFSRAVDGAKPRCVLLAMMMIAASSPMQAMAAEMPISTVQETLKREQFFYGEPSGVLDEPTRAALRRFQIRYGLPVSGEIDQATLQALQSPREKDAAGTPASVAGTASKAEGSAPTTSEKDREFLQNLQQSEPAPGKAPAVPMAVAPAAPAAPAAAEPAPYATGEGGARVVGRPTTVQDDPATPPRTGTSTSEPTQRVTTRTTTTIVTDGAETDDDPDPLGPHGVRIIRPPGTVPAPSPTVPRERTRIVEETRTTTVSPATAPPARVPAPKSTPAFGLPTYPQADEPPSRVQPEPSSRKPPGFLQRLFRGDR